MQINQLIKPVVINPEKVLYIVILKYILLKIDKLTKS
jgi:hypothetical protein